MVNQIQNSTEQGLVSLTLPTKAAIQAITGTIPPIRSAGINALQRRFS